MENKSKNAQPKKVLSRNRNKNKNRTLQNRAKERELAKREKAMRLAREVEEAVEELSVDGESLRADVLVVPDRTCHIGNTIDDGMLELEDITLQMPSVEEDKDEDDFIQVKVNRFRFADDNDEDNKSDKFNFTTEADGLENKDEVLEDYHYINEDEDEKVYDDDTDVVTVETTSEVEEIIPRPTDTVDVNARRHISFEKRVLGWVVFIIISFFVAGILIFKTVTDAKAATVTYDEKSSINYNVCINEETYSQYYATSCLDEDMEYLTAIAERVPTTFKYTVNYSEEVEKTLDYYVVAKVVIAKDENGKVLNTVEDVLVDRTNYSVFSKKADFLVDVDIPIKKYVDYVNNYNNQFGLSSYATLEVVFYVDNGTSIKRVSALDMSISNTTFNIERTITENEKQLLDVEKVSAWDNLNTSYAIVGLIFILIGLLGIIKLSDLVYKVIGTSSLYQKKLNRILREYDKLIVIARGEYNVDASKKLIKVASFGELLDARDTLEKPIVYLKVNSVKSEFYVEDSEAIYKYTMKEADFGGK